MGQAKRRGTFAERLAQAQQRSELIVSKAPPIVVVSGEQPAPRRIALVQDAGAMALVSALAALPLERKWPKLL